MRVGRPQEGVATFVAKGVWEVTFLNWDKVPTRLFSVGGRNRRDPMPVFEQVIFSSTGAEHAFLATRSWVDAAFLAAEVQRVVYGLGAITEREYLGCVRTSRPVRSMRTQEREVLWRLMMGTRPAIFADARIDALRRTRSGVRQKLTFTHVLVDECQDFLRADFELLETLIADCQHLCVFGDEAQGLHIGSSYRRPGSLGQRRWKVHQLDGSYRLPIRVCEGSRHWPRS